MAAGRATIRIFPSEGLPTRPEASPILLISAREPAFSRHDLPRWQPWLSPLYRTLGPYPSGAIASRFGAAKGLACRPWNVVAGYSQWSGAACAVFPEHAHQRKLCSTTPDNQSEPDLD